MVTGRTVPGIYVFFVEPTPEWVGWTVAGPSPAEGCFLAAHGRRVTLVDELAQVPHYPRNDAVPGGYV